MHLLEVNITASTIGSACDVDGQGAEGGDRIDQHAPPERAGGLGERRHVMHDAGAGLAVDQAEMRDGGIGGERRAASRPGRIRRSPGTASATGSRPASRASRVMRSA